jgi:glycerate kinase
VSLGASANGIKTATIAAGGSASSDGTVTIVTAHGASLSSSSVG